MDQHSQQGEAAALAENFISLLTTVRKLRSPEGCPWDRAQTLQTIKKNLLEECCEVLEAIDADNPAALKEELGDLLLQVLLQSEICREQGQFELGEVIATLQEKLVNRHPHVFGRTSARTPEEALASWHAAKRSEKGSEPSVIGSIPRYLPALAKAQKVQRRAAEVGFDWPDTAGVVTKIQEELEELRAALARGEKSRVADELGDLLFSVVNLCRHVGVEAEEALQRAVARFVSRFNKLEARLKSAGREIRHCSLAEMDRIWEEIKKAEGGPPTV